MSARWLLPYTGAQLVHGHYESEYTVNRNVKHSSIHKVNACTFDFADIALFIWICAFCAVNPSALLFILCHLFSISCVCFFFANFMRTRHAIINFDYLRQPHTIWLPFDKKSLLWWYLLLFQFNVRNGREKMATLWQNERTNERKKKHSATV